MIILNCNNKACVAATVKISLVLLGTIVTLKVIGQSSLSFSVKLKSPSRELAELPAVLDTVFLNDNFQETNKIYTNIPASDSLFILPEVSIGRHLLLFSTRNYCVWPLTIVVCTRCDNQFYFFTSPKTQLDDCKNIFEMVEVEPGYKGGDKQLSQEFRKNLTRNEKKLLKSIPDFTVHFFVTKQKKISDISTVQSEIPREAKNIIIRALDSLKNWSPAIRNGVIVDAEYTLNKKVLFGR